MDNKITLFTKVHTLVSFIIMLLANFLANILPLNNVTTGYVSDYYSNLFAPAGITFSIWGVIYLLLAGYLLYQFDLFKVSNNLAKNRVVNKISLYFTATSVANTVWIFMWHFWAIGISFIIILLMFILLAIINKKIANENLSSKEKLFIKVPFGIYWGWITVAVIANFVTYCVSLGWDGFTEPNWFYAVLLIVLTFLIGLFILIKTNNHWFGLALLWAFGGILIKHTSESGFAGKYPLVIAVLIVTLILQIITQVYLWFRKNKKENLVE